MKLLLVQLLVPILLALLVIAATAYVVRHSQKAFHVALAFATVIVALPILMSALGLRFLYPYGNVAFMICGLCGLYIFAGCFWRLKLNLIPSLVSALLVVLSPIAAFILTVVVLTEFEENVYEVTGRDGYSCVVTYFPVMLNPGWTVATLYWRPAALPMVQFRRAYMEQYDLGGTFRSFSPNADDTLSEHDKCKELFALYP